jgi:hypothetical protein
MRADLFDISRGTAVISDCGRYRYSLTRSWADGDNRVVFVMLNPSTADAEVDDPTIRRCIGFAKAWAGRRQPVCLPRDLACGHEG